MTSLSSLLVRDQIVGVRRIEEALQRQVVHGGDLETNLLELGAVSEDVLALYRAQIEGLGSVAAAEVMHPDPDAVALLTPELAERHRMIPLRIEGTRLLVAVASPPPPGTLDELSFLLFLDFVPRITTELRIAAALAHVFGIPMAPRFARLTERLGPVPFGGVARAHVVSVSSSRDPANKADDRVIALVGGKRPSERATPAPEPKLVVEPSRPPREEETERGLSAVPAPRLVVEPAAPPRDDTTDRGIAPSRDPGVVVEPAPESSVEDSRPTAVDEPRLVVEPATPPRDEETERVFTPVPREHPPPRRRRKMGPSVAMELLEAAGTRDEVLEILLEVANQTLDYVAVFVVGESSADGRAAIGAGATTERLRTLSIPLDRPSFVRTVKESRSHLLGPIHDEDSNHAILRDLGRAPPANAVVLPIVLRSRVVLLIYGDNGRRPTAGEDIVELLALAPKVAAALERLILARKFAGYASVDPDARRAPSKSEPRPKRPSPVAPTAAALSEIIAKRPSVAAAEPKAEVREEPLPLVTPRPLRSQKATMVGHPPDPSDLGAAVLRARAKGTLQGVPAIDVLDERRDPAGTLEMLVPVTGAPATLQGIPAVDTADEPRAPARTVQMSVPPEARAVETEPLATGDSAIDTAGEPRGPATTVQISVPPEARTAETEPLVTGESAIDTAGEPRAPARTVQISVPPEARTAETEPLVTCESADAPDAATAMPSPVPVMAAAILAETAPPHLESATGSPANLAESLRGVAEGVAPPSASAGSPAEQARAAATPDGAAGSSLPPSEVDTGPIRDPEPIDAPSGAAGPSRDESPVPRSEVETAPLRTAAAARPGPAPGDKVATIPRTSEIPTGEESDGDEPELTVSPWHVGGDDSTFTPPPRVADTLGEVGIDLSTRPTDPAPEPEDQPRQPPELGPVSGSSVGKRRVYHDAFRVDVLTPLPVPDQSIPSVIVDMGPNIESLVDSLLRGGEEGDLAAAALQKIGEGAIPALVQRFPGPLAFDRHSPHTRLPRVGECGPILRMLPGFRQHAVPYLLPLLSSPSAEIRFYATFLFSELQYPEAIPGLAPLLWDADHQTRILAIDVLKGFRRFQAFANLTKELRKSAWDASVPPAKRRVAVEAIGELRDADAVALLVELLGHEDAHLSELCWRSLVLITRQDFGQAKKKWQQWLQKEGSRHHVEWLIDALVHPSPELRLGASEELKRITKEYFGYYYNLPRRDREKARKRYLEWWDRIGRARFTGQRP